MCYALQIETMENFFKAEGLTKIMLYYQEVDANLPEGGACQLCIILQLYLGAILSSNILFNVWYG